MAVATIQGQVADPGGLQLLLADLLRASVECLAAGGSPRALGAVLDWGLEGATGSCREGFKFMLRDWDLKLSA